MAKNRDNPLQRIAREFIELELPKEISQLYNQQQALTRALGKCKPKILDMPNVKGVGVGYHRKGKKISDCIGPVVYVSKKVSLGRLKKSQTIPKNITYRGKRYRIDVQKITDIQPLCSLNVPDTQHLAHDPIPPDVAIQSVDPNSGIPLASGSGGCFVVRPSSNAMYLLSVRHVLLARNINITQPWSTRVVGGTVAVSTRFDAGIAEVQSPEGPNFNLPTPNFHCFGPAPLALDPIVGMTVKKSGAATGLTNSSILGTFALNPAQPGSADMLMGGQSVNPPPIPPGLGGSPYLSGGDSGSTSLLGHSFNSIDFGAPINSAISTFVSALPRRDRVMVMFIILAYLRNGIVGLNYAVTTVGGGSVGVAHPIKPVLADLGVRLA